MKTLRIFTVLLGLTTSMSAMEDTPNNRARAADQFLQIYSVQETLAASFNKISQTMPQPKRDMFESVISHLDMQAVSHVMRQSLIANFTADDLNALSDFLSTPAGKSILEKFSSGRYMDLSTRDIQVYNDFFGTQAGKLFLAKFRKYQAELKSGVSSELRKAVLRALPEIVHRARTS
jgi:hypothetical protein